MVRGLRPYCLRSEGESGVLVGVCETLRCNARGSRLAIPKLNCPVETGRPHEAEPGAVQILPGRTNAETRDYDRAARCLGRVAGPSHKGRGGVTTWFVTVCTSLLIWAR